MTRNYRVDVFYGAGTDTVHYTTEFEEYWLAKTFAKAARAEKGVCSVYILERDSSDKFDITECVTLDAMAIIKAQSKATRVKDILEHFDRTFAVSIYNQDVTVCEAAGTCGNIAEEFKAMKVRDWRVQPDMLIITLQ